MRLRTTPWIWPLLPVLPIFPIDPRTKNIRIASKELRMVEHVVTVHEDQNWIHNKPIYVDFHGGCCDTKRRCDLRTLIGNTMLVLECDEGQHKNYADEDARYDDLFMDFSGRYVFIRFNPDNYRIGGVLLKTPWDERLKSLTYEIHKQIRRIVAGGNTSLVEVIHLYFDK